MPAEVDLGLAELEHLRLEGGLDQVGEVGPGTVGVVDLGIAVVEVAPEAAVVVLKTALW